MFLRCNRTTQDIYHSTYTWPKAPRTQSNKPGPPDDIPVLYAGNVAESGDAGKVLSVPSHPYTEALMSAVPVPDPDAEPTMIRLPGSVPNLRARFEGCFFAGRCPRKLGPKCDQVQPPALEAPEGNHVIYCDIPLDELAELQGG